MVPVVLLEPVPHHLLDDLVRNQKPLAHDSLDAGRQLRMVLHVPAEDVADGNMSKIEVLAEQAGLGALARPLRTDHDVFVHSKYCPFTTVATVGNLSQPGPR